MLFTGAQNIYEAVSPGCRQFFLCSPQSSSNLQAIKAILSHQKIVLNMSVSYYTQEGLDKIKEELHYLKTKGRADIARQIAEAGDKGDLSENAEYDAAKDAQGLHELKISKLEEIMSKARVIDEAQLDTSKVSILSNVKIKNKKNGAVVTYKLVSEEEADLKSGKISVQSPIGKGLLGKKVGETAQIQAPAGVVEFEIVDISI
jgi:transcription elongation factor GreA